MEDDALDRIRLAKVDDAQGILAIYAPIVRETTISFELEPPTPEEMQARIQHTLERYPWLVFESGGEVCGYAYASRHRERGAYQWSVDVSVYVAAASRRQGIARQLYTPLFGILQELRYYSALAGIVLPNSASVALHEAMGFQPIGVYRNIGYKLGAWRDVGWWQRPLRPYTESPEPPKGLAESEAWKSRLAG
jgi:phosphinothricin acetyltransferase